MSIVPTLFLGVEYCATFQAALYIETHSLMHQSEFHGASVALSRAADKRKSLINIHKNGYAATLRWRCANLMRFITLQVALFSSNAILYRRAPVCIVFVYRYTSIIASFSHEVLANVEQLARPV